MRTTLLAASLLLLAATVLGGATLYPSVETNLSLGPATIVEGGGLILLSLLTATWAASGRLTLNFPIPSLREAVPKGRFGPWLLFLLGAMAAFSSLFSLCREDSILALGLLVGLLAVYLVVASCAQSGEIPLLLVGICTVNVLVCLWGLFQYFHGTPTPPAWVASALRSAIPVRVYSTLANPNFLASYLLLSGGAALSLALQRRSLWTWGLGIGTAALATINLLLTYSRGGYLGLGIFLVATIVLLPRRGQNLRLLSPYLLLVLAASFFPAIWPRFFSILVPLPGDTQAARFFTWSVVLDSILAHPLLGNGWGTLNAVFSAHRPPGIFQPYALPEVPGSANNDYLQLAAEIGIPGSILLLGGAGRALYRNILSLFQAPSSESWRIPLLAAFLGLAAQAFFEVSLHLIAVDLLGVILLALWSVKDPVPPLRLRRFGRTVCAILFVGFLALAGFSIRPWLAQNYYRAGQTAQAAALDPWNPRYQYALGISAEALSPERATAFFRQASALSPAYPDPHVGLAASLTLTGQLAAAATEYKKAITLDPYNPYTLTAYAGLIAPQDPTVAFVDAAYARRLYPLLRGILKSQGQTTVDAAAMAHKNQALLTSLGHTLGESPPKPDKPIFP